MKKVELLAPAGNYECFLAAMKAGADAVYLGGSKFGARAYAENFTDEEICKAIRLAHIWGKKVYLTLNTLLKDDEMEEVYDYILPFYEEGLDGIIIQDLGVFRYIKKHFHDLELHCSTQMTITGKYGALFAKEIGSSRIVPARELSLEEIKEIYDSVDIEIEAFIHGAMCYCYSGQCLFSSMLGGRSGNRGKCAQPCRLPYSVDKKEKKERYPLSLKDMCSIEILPSLLESGIASFKIEGRMKKPEYVAGVTGIYRKYIDLYYENPSKEFKINPKDLKILHSLYVRSEVQDGYYFRQNGKEMVTLNQPSYSTNNDEILTYITNHYLKKNMVMKVRAICSFRIGKLSSLTLCVRDTVVTVYGQVVEEAKKAPVTKDDIVKSISQMGNTSFMCEKIEVDMDEAVFYPLKALKELRRNGIFALEEALINKNYPNKENRHFLQKKSDIVEEKNLTFDKNNGMRYVSVCTKEQFYECLRFSFIDVFILDSSLCNTIKEWKDFLNDSKKLIGDRKIYLALPHVIRKKDISFLVKILEVLECKCVEGCLVRNLETFSFLKTNNYSKKIILDANFYLFNLECVDFWNERNVNFTYPYELNSSERRKISENGGKGILEIYGRIPMMITANCIQKTMEQCDGKSHKRNLIDRYGVNFPTVMNCKHCYNIIYNSTPLSLHKNYKKIVKTNGCRFSFTIESKEETREVLKFFQSLESEQPLQCPYENYTTGHEKRGVE